MVEWLKQTGLRWGRPQPMTISLKKSFPFTVRQRYNSAIEIDCLVRRWQAACKSWGFLNFPSYLSRRLNISMSYALISVQTRLPWKGHKHPQPRLTPKSPKFSRNCELASCFEIGTPISKHCFLFPCWKKSSMRFINFSVSNCFIQWFYHRFFPNWDPPTSPIHRWFGRFGILQVAQAKSSRQVFSAGGPLSSSLMVENKQITTNSYLNEECFNLWSS